MKNKRTERTVIVISFYIYMSSRERIVVTHCITTIKITETK